MHLRDLAAILVSATVSVATIVTPAAAETAAVGTATASSVGAWVKPTGCSQFPVDYAGLPPDASATIDVLDAATRDSLGSAYVLSGAPRSGRVNVQVCSFRTDNTTSIQLSLDVFGQGVADSPAFAWSPKPKTVRCVNKRTYTIKEFSGRSCPKGWVKR